MATTEKTSKLPRLYSLNQKPYPLWIVLTTTSHLVLNRHPRIAVTSIFQSLCPEPADQHQKHLHCSYRLLHLLLQRLLKTNLQPLSVSMSIRHLRQPGRGLMTNGHNRCRVCCHSQTQPPCPRCTLTLAGYTVVSLAFCTYIAQMFAVLSELACLRTSNCKPCLLRYKRMHEWLISLFKVWTVDR